MYPVNCRATDHVPVVFDCGLTLLMMGKQAYWASILVTE